MAKIKVPEFKTIIDTREQTPYEFFDVENIKDKDTGAILDRVFHPWNTERRKLDTGDYSIEGHETIFTIERKSLSDFLGCVFDDRFDRELQRLEEFPHAYILIEASFDDIAYPERVGSGANPHALFAKLASYSLKHNVQIIPAHNRLMGQMYAQRLMRLYWRYFQERALASQKG